MNIKKICTKNKYTLNKNLRKSISPTSCIWQCLFCMFVCLQSLNNKGTMHLLPTLQNNEPVPQAIEPGCKPVLFYL